MGEYSVHSDIVKNRMYVALRGFLTNEEAQAAADAIIAESASLRSGFDVINDITTFQPVSPDSTAQITRVQQFLIAKGMRRLIRVLQNPSLGGLQLRRKAKEFGYEANVAASIEEAEQMLDQPPED